MRTFAEETIAHMEYSIDRFAAMTESAIAALKYPATAPGLYEPIKYALASGGKRLRPALCLAVYAALSHRDPAEVINQALAVEMFHNFTLLHDDVMDCADIRRGRPTVHRRWGENAAILSGDAMLTMAYGLLTDNAGDKFPALFEEFNRTAMEVYQGQQLDMEFENRSDVTVAEYIEMIKLKTSVLLGCACRLGAIAAGAEASVCDSFYAYGVAMGLAFQLRDDWLDTFGDPAIFGKEIGGDIINKKKTWLLINAMAEMPDELPAILAEDLEDREKIRQVTAAYRSLHLDHRCSELANRYSADAITALGNVALDKDALAFFTALAESAATRNH